MATLSKDKTYVTVVKGDTLSEIAQAYASYIAGTGIYGDNGKLATLKKINDIENVNYIVVGQKIKLTGSSSAKKNTSSTPTIKVFGVQSNSGGRTMYATWTWSKSNTENYQVIWQYDTGDSVWFNGSDSTVTDKQSLYTAPNNAVRVRFKVKPVSKKRKVNGKETSYWTASWSTIKTYSFSSNPPVIPTGLSATIDTLSLTATLSNVDTSVDGINASHVQFRIYRVVNGTNKLFKTSGNVQIVNKYVSYKCDVTAGYSYFVSCRAVRGSLYSDWSDMVDAGETVPAAPSKITKCSAVSDSEVYLEWTSVNTADSYTIEYATDKKLFDASSDVKSQNVASRIFYYLSFGDKEQGKEWFFRVCAKNGAGESKWSPITSVVLGDAPNAPTTWSSTTTAIVDENEPVTLYWVHNAKDESDPTKAQLELTIIRGDTTSTIIHNYDYKSHTGSATEDLDEGEESSGILDWLKGAFDIKASDDDTSGDNSEDEDTADSYTIQTSNLGGGTTIEWRIRTAGATGALGEWSIMRTIEVYNRPEINPFSVTDYEGATVETLTQFPINIEAVATLDNNQYPIGYYLTVTALGDYETVDDTGNAMSVRSGDKVYSKYFDITGMLKFVDDESVEDRTGPALSASDMDLENNIEYTITCTVAMNSGLTGEATHNFTVSWTDEQYEPNAEISIDEEAVTASIRPHCENEDGELVQDVLLSVYRREFDGTFTELAKDINNVGYTYVTDPHPSLDYARYRIIAKSTVTGAISSYDVPGYPVGEKAVIIQWAEDWTNFDATVDGDGNYVLEDTRDEAVWSGSMLRLPYNVDVSDNTKPDVALIEYIGRRHPVSYYGTHVGSSATWNVAIDKSDKETLYALRRLAVWMGDAYVREPSGSGYWANVTVSFSQKHCETTIPVTLNITRVEGGV